MAHAHETRDGAFHHREADVGVRHLAAAELEPEFNLVAMVEKLLGMAELGLEVVVFDARGKLDLLDFARSGLHVRGLLRLLVDVFAEVHDAAHRRRGVGCDLDEIQADFQCEVHRLGGIEHAELLALGRDHANLRDLDAVVAADGRERVDIATMI